MIWIFTELRPTPYASASTSLSSNAYAVING